MEADVAKSLRDSSYTRHGRSTDLDTVLTSLGAINIISMLSANVYTLHFKYRPNLRWVLQIEGLSLSLSFTYTTYFFFFFFHIILHLILLGLGLKTSVSVRIVTWLQFLSFFPLYRSSTTKPQLSS